MFHHFIGKQRVDNSRRYNKRSFTVKKVDIIQILNSNNLNYHFFSINSQKLIRKFNNNGLCTMYILMKMNGKYCLTIESVCDRQYNLHMKLNKVSDQINAQLSESMIIYLWNHPKANRTIFLHSHYGCSLFSLHLTTTAPGKTLRRFFTTKHTFPPIVSVDGARVWRGDKKFWKICSGYGEGCDPITRCPGRLINSPRKPLVPLARCGRI